MTARSIIKAGSPFFNNPVYVWSQFFACLLLVGYAGVKLTVYGDAIADKTGLGGNWIGFLLIGIVTSVPELTSGISAVTLADAPDLAVGAIFGACIFNLAIIVILDLLLGVISWVLLLLLLINSYFMYINGQTLD